MRNLDQLWNKLQACLLELAASGQTGSAGASGSLAIAFSGGVDSRLLTHAAALLGLKVLALHFCGPHFRCEAEAAALAWLRGRAGNLEYALLEVDALALDAVRHNRPDRCYHCKKLAFGLLLDEARRRGKNCLCDGSLASDNQEYRPGRRAMAELGIVSPLAELGFSKAEVRALGAELGLDDTAQQGQPCLLTRFAYGLEVTPELLRLLDLTESAVAAVIRQVPYRSERGDLPFRLRLLTAPAGRKITAELHLQLTPESLAAQPKLRENLANALAAQPFAAHGLEQAKIVAMPDLSGFFDRKQRD